jgi:hypothetical protein
VKDLLEAFKGNWTTAQHIFQVRADLFPPCRPAEANQQHCVVCIDHGKTFRAEGPGLNVPMLLRLLKSEN